MQIKQNVPLADYTSFKLGGKAENFAEVSSSSQLLDLIKSNSLYPIWLIGYGSNTLISDHGLPGLTICIKGGELTIEEDVITADAGVWWDDIVKLSIEKNLWGIELMSEIPGSLGAALFINITAYGQSIGSRVLWIDVWDETEHRVKRLEKEDLVWGYKNSVFQKENNQLIILRASIKLSTDKIDELVYQKAVDVSDELKLDKNNLQDRRKIIIEARKRAGSLWHPNEEGAAHTAGSFFRNPVVTEQVAEMIMDFDESNKTHEEIRTMNKVHGGSTRRVSAAHVMLAAGFKRGQNWGNVKLNDQNLLKIEALQGATASELYAVVQEIQRVCMDKLHIRLEPEARIIGSF